jgi:RHS repeat-associated protein
VPGRAAWCKHYSCVIAHGDLAQLNIGGTVLSAFQYDAISRNTVASQYSSGTLVLERHYYYDARWQAIEERLGGSDNADRQMVFGTKRIDDIVLRDRDPDDGGVLSERVYALQDANLNVTALVSALGNVVERYEYAGYGMPTFMSPLFVPIDVSNFDWCNLFAAYPWESDSGIYLVQHRSLNSLIGSWTTRDPFGLDAGLNLYSYADCNPIVRLDPMGLDPSYHHWLPQAFRQFMNGSCNAVFPNIVDQLTTRLEGQATEPGTPLHWLTYRERYNNEFRDKVVDNDSILDCCDALTAAVVLIYNTWAQMRLLFSELGPLPTFVNYSTHNPRDLQKILDEVCKPECRKPRGPIRPNPPIQLPWLLENGATILRAYPKNPSGL